MKEIIIFPAVCFRTWDIKDTAVYYTARKTLLQKNYRRFYYSSVVATKMNTEVENITCRDLPRHFTIEQSPSICLITPDESFRIPDEYTLPRVTLNCTPQYWVRRTPHFPQHYLSYPPSFSLIIV